MSSRPARFSAFALLFATCLLSGHNSGGHAQYVGGTIEEIPSGCSGSVDSVDKEFFVFYARKASWRVPYDHINLLEYGQKVDRRYISAVFFSPLLLMSKKRQHFLTVGYSNDDGKQEAMIFRVAKQDIRSVLVSLEARTGRKVEFQDDEARKAGKG